MNRFVEFGKIAEFRNGLNFSKDSRGKGCLLIGVPDFKNNFSPQYDNLQEINPDGVSKDNDYIKKGDLIFVRSNGNKALVGRSLYITKDIKALYSGFCIRARLNSDIIDPLFLAYYTKSKYFKKSISYADGTNINNLNQDILSGVKIPLYSKRTQHNIVNFLSTIDKKIELNNQINSELEAIAKLIYDYWFVQFDFPDKNKMPYKSSGGEMVYNEDLRKEIPNTWSVRNISEKLQISSGYPFKSVSYLDSGTYKIVTIKNVQDNRLELNNTDFVNSIPSDIDSSCILTLQDILISLTGNVGRICLVDEQNLLLNQRVGKFQTDPILKNYFYLTYQRPEFRSWLEKISPGTSQKNLSPIEAVNRLHPFPNSSTLIEFEKLVGPMIKKILLNLEENKRLETQRNWILPMLMNGQVTVNEAS
tara:strand:- start:132 stop:1388 length:1257 start_codon:yes stop_codon:yes gene_type:complete